MEGEVTWEGDDVPPTQEELEKEEEEEDLNEVDFVDAESFLNREVNERRRSFEDFVDSTETPINRKFFPELPTEHVPFDVPETPANPNFAHPEETPGVFFKARSEPVRESLSDSGDDVIRLSPEKERAPPPDEFEEGETTVLALDYEDSPAIGYSRNMGQLDTPTLNRLLEKHANPQKRHRKIRHQGDELSHADPVSSGVFDRTVFRADDLLSSENLNERLAAVGDQESERADAVTSSVAIEIESVGGEPGGVGMETVVETPESVRQMQAKEIVSSSDSASLSVEKTSSAILKPSGSTAVSDENIGVEAARGSTGEPIKNVQQGSEKPVHGRARTRSGGNRRRGWAQGLQVSNGKQGKAKEVEKKGQLALKEEEVNGKRRRREKTSTNHRRGDRAKIEQPTTQTAQQLQRNKDLSAEIKFKEAKLLELDGQLQKKRQEMQKQSRSSETLKVDEVAKRREDRAEAEAGAGAPKHHHHHHHRSRHRSERPSESVTGIARERQEPSVSGGNLTLIYPSSSDILFPFSPGLWEALRTPFSAPVFAQQGVFVLQNRGPSASAVTCRVSSPHEGFDVRIAPSRIVIRPHETRAFEVNVGPAPHASGLVALSSLYERVHGNDLRSLIVAHVVCVVGDYSIVCSLPCMCSFFPEQSQATANGTGSTKPHFPVRAMTIPDSGARTDRGTAAGAAGSRCISGPILPAGVD